MRCFILWLLASLPLGLFAQTTIKISTLYPPGSAPVASLQGLAEDIAEASNGDLELKIYPGGVMGDDRTVLRKIRIGQLHGALVSSSTLDSVNVDLDELSHPFQFEALEQVYTQREQYDEVFRQRLSSEGWRSFGPLDGGFSYLMSKQPVTSMSALRQSKLWLPNTEDIQRMAKSLDVNYLVMNIGDVLTGLDTGAINTLVAPPAAALTLNWHSRFNYFTQTPVIYTWGMLVLPERVLAKLPDQQQKMLQVRLSQWASELDSTLRSSNQQALTVLGQLLEATSFNDTDLRKLRLSQR